MTATSPGASRGVVELVERAADDITAVLYMADSGEDAMAEIRGMLAALVAAAEERGAARIWSEYAREYESGAKMPRWDEDPAVAANGWRPGRCGNCGEALPR